MGELFKHTYSVDLLHVPYKTSAAAVTDLAAGRAQVGFFALGTVMPMVKAGKLRVLAASGDQRSSFVPNVPTFAEAGLGKIQASNWVGTFVAPATPNETAERIASHFTTLLADASFQQELLKSELVPNTSGAGRQEFSATVKADTARWKKVVADANIVTE